MYECKICKATSEVYMKNDVCCECGFLMSRISYFLKRGGTNASTETMKIVMNHFSKERSDG